MYTNFFGLQRLPFSLTPDPSVIFLPQRHREVLAGLTYAIVARKGFVVLTGDAGTGKTTFVNTVLGRLPPDYVESSVILNPTLTSSEFLEGVLLDFDIIDVPPSKAQRLWKLQNFLAENHQQNKVAVLVIDEAHKLSKRVLEEVRLLGNFESAEEKYLQIILVGQPELDNLLDSHDLRQFRQRVALRLSIDPLSPAEVGDYIRFRWTKAGGQLPPFTPEAIDVIAKWSQGIPRLINSVCDTALLMAHGDGVRSLDIRYAQNAAANLAPWHGNGLPPSLDRPPLPTFPPMVAAYSMGNPGSETSGVAALLNTARPVAAPPMFANAVSTKPQASFLRRLADRFGIGD